jgi:hypothetical protein
MNEQIQKLIDQATSYKEGLIEGKHDIEVFDKVKFAQLIVAECISTLEEKIYRSIDHEGDEIWIDLILKEHFGVEE